ncbi:hypothetical protein PybrP1_006850 [[Pythium] brassicae (nom. inval.)]|nr:hypothetical protein PybrP1_006850 [[Pythium] brassicae (nom. inval.)]
MRALALALALLLAPSDVHASGNGTSATGGNASPSSTSDASSTGTSSPSRRDLLKFDARSGLRPWVDPTTPNDKQVYVSSRGGKWDLVMSDEFGIPNRTFKPGEDHLWATVEKPDGVNGALELYSHDMAEVVCDKSDDGNSICYLSMKTIDEVNEITVYNEYTRPPSFQNVTFFYRAAMLQTWNKFCYQGGMIEMRVQLPGAVSKESGNPDYGKSPNARTTANDFYPTWPGLWLMGNLGRAIFSASTQRMWPFSYNQCDERVFPSYNQRISACNPNPGHGLNPFQGRGAPEIDILEGGGVGISSSIQIGPGFPPKYRRPDANLSIDIGYPTCFYSQDCKTPGANLPNVPTEFYAQRKHQTWYAGLRYTGNNFCEPDRNQTQSFAAIAASLKSGIKENRCTAATCPASNDVLSDLGFIDGNASLGHWGVNEKGTCFTTLNGYQGVFLCDPDSQNPLCLSPRNDSTAPTKTMAQFDYQMDAVSGNWPIHNAAYTSFLIYQLEWVTGDEGYIRWMLHGHPIFEIPAESILNVGQDETKSNVMRTFPEEPMYVILNVAVSQNWASHPPNAAAGLPCRGDGKDPVANRICDSFPMYMKIDYIRLYQDTATMAIGCDPATHPTRQWILDHIDEYTDDVNVHIDVNGGARCRTSKDCTIPWSKNLQFQTGFCNSRSVCECSNAYWGGPRCTFQLQLSSSSGEESAYGPPLSVAMVVAGVAFVATMLVVIVFARKRRAQQAARVEREEKNRLRKDADDVYAEKMPLTGADYEELETSKSSGHNPISYL